MGGISSPGGCGGAWGVLGIAGAAEEGGGLVGLFSPVSTDTLQARVVQARNRIMIMIDNFRIWELNIMCLLEKGKMGEVLPCIIINTCFEIHLKLGNNEEGNPQSGEILLLSIA